MSRSFFVLLNDHRREEATLRPTSLHGVMMVLADQRCGPVRLDGPEPFKVMVTLYDCAFGRWSIWSLDSRTSDMPFVDLTSSQSRSDSWLTFSLSSRVWCSCFLCLPSICSNPHVMVQMNCIDSLECEPIVVGGLCDEELPA